jgi:ceramide glucosyltransferase
VIALTLLLGVWSFAGFMFTVEAARQVRRLVARARRDAAAQREWPALQILRPCEGLDVELEENLLSTVTARYDGPRELFLLVPSTSDPAHAICERVKSRAPDSVKVHVVVTAIQTSANRKVAQLAAAPTTDAPVVIIADSDLRFDDETLPSLIAVLQADPKAGAAGAPLIEPRTETLGDYASESVLSSTPHAFLSLTALAERSGGAHVLCGALIAIKRPVLEEVGGFHSFEQFLGEDFELARRLHEKGHTIPTSAAPARASDHGRSLSVVLKRYVRWCMVTRQQRPHLFATYTLLLACFPSLLLLAALAAGFDAPYWPFAFIPFTMFFVSRVVLTSTLRSRYGVPATPFSSLPAMFVGELTIIFSALLALGPPVIEWRGHRYRVGPGGRLFQP